MQTVTIQITHKNAFGALQDLEQKHFIRIVEALPVLKAVSLPGKKLTQSEFKNWVEQTEKSNTISLKEAKSKWATKRKQLQQFIK
ncbi:MAG TPA: hypothetical protein PLU18_11770 [Ferruginibacter sp.]|nr:hypothetical protein [Ferruginibacter sp.]